MTHYKPEDAHFVDGDDKEDGTGMIGNSIEPITYIQHVQQEMSVNFHCDWSVLKKNTYKLYWRSLTGRHTSAKNRLMAVHAIYFTWRYLGKDRGNK